MSTSNGEKMNYNKVYMGELNSKIILSQGYRLQVYCQNCRADDIARAEHIQPFKMNQRA